MGLRKINDRGCSAEGVFGEVRTVDGGQWTVDGGQWTVDGRR